MSAEIAAGSDMTRERRVWLTWTLIAFFGTLWHILIDMHIGLWGETSRDIRVMQGINLAAHAALFTAWGLAIIGTISGDRWAWRGLLIFNGVWAMLLNGLVAFFAAPPPSAAFPFQDIAHAVGLLAGAGATWSAWKFARPRNRTGNARMFVAVVVILILGQVAAGIVFVQEL